ncbi:MAG TPA: hypothetical protein VNC50_15215, partial [Planctomycetia bacterium]|nr:hypothetical protein [Planctomycetia bacterium]
NNMFLALERADGVVLRPSFHDLYRIRELELANAFGGAPDVTHPNPAYTRQVPDTVAGFNPANPVLNGRRMIFRPRQIDVDYNTVAGTGQPAQFPALIDVNNNGVIGDIPDELDVDTDGDGKPDSVWVDLGYPPYRMPDGSLAKPLFAFKVLGLDGRVNVNIAGNLLRNRSATNPNSIGYPGRPEGHTSFLGASQTEINPKHIFPMSDTNRVGGPTQDATVTRPDYWPEWIVTDPGTGGPNYYDHRFLRFLLMGNPGPASNPTYPGAAPFTPAIAGKWNDRTGIPSATVDQVGVNDADNDGNRLTDGNSTYTVGAATGVRQSSSSLGPVSGSFGRRHPPFSSKTKALILAGLDPATPLTDPRRAPAMGRIFPTHVDHLQGSIQAYWPGHESTTTANSPVSRAPWNYFNSATPMPFVAAPLALSGGTAGDGAFDSPTSATAPSQSRFGIPNVDFFYTMSNSVPAALRPLETAQAVQPPIFSNGAPPRRWEVIPGRIRVDNANLPDFVNELYYLMTHNEATEINPYSAASADNLFTDAQLEALLRGQDIDASALDDRLKTLLAFVLGDEQLQISPYADSRYQ